MTKAMLNSDLSCRGYLLDLQINVVTSEGDLVEESAVLCIVLLRNLQEEEMFWLICSPV